MRPLSLVLMKGAMCQASAEPTQPYQCFAFLALCVLKQKYQLSLLNLQNCEINL